jgi:hypothetical protein
MPPYRARWAATTSLRPACDTGGDGGPTGGGGPAGVAVLSGGGPVTTGAVGVRSVCAAAGGTTAGWTAVSPVDDDGVLCPSGVPAVEVTTVGWSERALSPCASDGVCAPAAGPLTAVLPCASPPAAAGGGTASTERVASGSLSRRWPGMSVLLVDPGWIVAGTVPLRRRGQPSAAIMVRWPG